MKYLLAIDSFKGCLTSAEAEEAAAEGIKRVNSEADIKCIPVSDGGEGMLDAFLSALGGTKVRIRVFNAMLQRIEVEYGRIGNTAIIETARIIGLSSIPPELRNPLLATSYGVGQVLAHAIDKGCDTFIIGLGGSVTSDCGIGMLKALVDHFASGKGFDAVPLKNLKFTLACDVDNPLYGDQGAAIVFSPQKGATDKMIPLLERRAKTFAALSARHYGHDDSSRPGAGAAGGLGYAFMQYLGAEKKNGIDLLLHLLHFDSLLADRDVVVTGEGKSDNQTLMGKLPVGVLNQARKQKIPVVLIAGQIKDEADLQLAGFSRIVCINPPGLRLEEAVQPETARKNIAETLSRICKDGLGIK